MRAMILAAGRGERMRPLTDTCPKPLLEVGGTPLIVWHIRRLVAAGIQQIIINHAWLGAQIEASLGDGHAFGAQIVYSPEPCALETAGGIARALPFFQGAPFLVINGDIWSDWDPGLASTIVTGLDGDHTLAHLVLVDNPPHHPRGDFALAPSGRHVPDGTPLLTFAGIGLYHPQLFAGLAPKQAAPLAPLLRRAIAQDRISATHHRGSWVDIGTPERLQTLDRCLRLQQSEPFAGDVPSSRC
ncbi:MAG TPA: nucleotidyltransferase family protein [Castellaniella sp.]|nr:nucleotidyltransferase family protein [Castellaniella sp.]